MHQLHRNPGNYALVREDDQLILLVETQTYEIAHELNSGEKYLYECQGERYLELLAREVRERPTPENIRG